MNKFFNLRSRTFLGAMKGFFFMTLFSFTVLIGFLMLGMSVVSFIVWEPMFVFDQLIIRLTLVTSALFGFSFAADIYRGKA